MDMAKPVTVVKNGMVVGWRYGKTFLPIHINTKPMDEVMMDNILAIRRIELDQYRYGR
jgi:hypothetical protein